MERPPRREEMIRILIADDQRDVLEALRILLKGEGYQTEAATSLAGIFNSLEKKEYAYWHSITTVPLDIQLKITP